MDNVEIRELFIDELEQVNGGNPVKELIDEIRNQPSTMACCEEGNDGCGCSPW